MLTPFEVISECAKVGSTNAKQEILANNSSELLKKILNYALDPYKVFGVKKFEFVSPQKDLNYDPWPSIFECLDKLMKRVITGDMARENIKKTSGLLTANEQEVFARILSKDLKCGVAEGIVNKVFPKLIPEFEVQLAQPHKVDRINYPCLVQPKYDGVRTIALVDPKENSVVYYSRNGKEFKNFSCFDKELIRLAGKDSKMFDGEVVGPPGDDFRGIMTQCRRKYDVEPKGLNYNVFDWMPMHHFTRQNVTLNQSERTSYLEELESMDVNLHEKDRSRVFIVASTKCESYEECMVCFEEAINKGYEGIIIKDIKSEYEFKRNYNWQKVKPNITEDLKIIDIQEGRGKYEGKLGAFIVEREGVKINVGSGLLDDERVSIEESQNMIGKTIEVCYDALTPDKSLRFPRFIRFREDK